MATKIKVVANLGWLDCEKHGLDESYTEKVKEDKVLSVPDKDAAVLVNKIRCATFINQPAEATK